jgi:hypothetical protein
MKLVTEELRAQLPLLYRQERNRDPMVHAKPTQSVWANPSNPVTVRAPSEPSSRMNHEVIYEPPDAHENLTSTAPPKAARERRKTGPSLSGLSVRPFRSFSS